MNILFMGGFGNNTLNYFIENKLISQNNQYYLLNTDKRTLIKENSNKNNFNNINTILLFENYFSGLGSDGHIDKVMEIALKNEEYLLSFLDKNGLNIFVTGLAGGTGTGLCGAYNEILKKYNYNVCFIVTTPFEFEGEYKKRIASGVIDKIKNGNILIIPNEKLFHIMDRKALLSEAFGFVSKFIHWVIEIIGRHSNITINELNDDEKKYLSLISFEDINLFINKMNNMWVQ
ncbi:MAG: hypothetical protein Ta2B_16400 [Termitinemataceae bacterium]|nr:MAG: hypothetical protein Ta2B_16400 [Termitinemataceae bacterium]